ncbi:MAG: winged helix-turn-helix domain-containing protein [Desulfurella sp.]|jgi:DNA-binding transcriptional ArsR family regulator
MTIYIDIPKSTIIQILKDLKEKELGGALNTLWWFFNEASKIPTENLSIKGDPEIIAEDLGLSKVIVYKHIKKLKELDYIKQVDPKRHLYSLNSSMFVRRYFFG